jgi:hypothetical protein
MEHGTWTIAPCAHTDVRLLADGLGVSETTASVLARRGHTDLAEARAFLDGALPGHDPLALGDMPAAVEALRAAIARGARICVHGDYDADGICATALAVLLLRELGAEPAWHLPSRFEEGYGLNGQTLARLADEGFDLVLTVDCGITAVGRGRGGGALGLEVVVTDHHRPGETVHRVPRRSRPAARAIPVRRPLRHGASLEARRGDARRWSSVPRAAPRRGRAAKTSPTVVAARRARTAALACRACGRLAQTQRAGLRALIGAPRASTRRPSTIGAIGSARPRINASGPLCRPGVGAAPAADRGRGRGEATRERSSRS